MDKAPLKKRGSCTLLIGGWVVIFSTMSMGIKAAEGDVVMGNGGVTGNANTGVWELYEQLEQLQQEVQQLRGAVEQQAYRLDILQQQQKKQYLDLDHRLNTLRQSTHTEGSTVGRGADGAEDAQRQGDPDGTGLVSTLSEAQFKEEKARYQAANKLIQNRQLREAEEAFKQLLIEFPDGAFAAYAHYWLGEVYMALPEQPFDLAQEHFETVLEEYPNHPKEGATLYKMGKLYHLKGDREKAILLLNKAVNLDPSSRVSDLARRYLEHISNVSDQAP